MKRSKEESNLDIKLHPLLSKEYHEIKKPKITKSSAAATKTVNNGKVNPYYNPQDQFLDKLGPKSVINMNSEGKPNVYDYDDERNKLLEMQQKYKENLLEEQRLEQLKASGLVLDELRGEFGWQKKAPPGYIEWWDQVLIRGDRYPINDRRELDMDKCLFEGEAVTHYIHHPLPPSAQQKDVENKVYLTKMERRKLRKNRRLIKQNKLREQIQSGEIRPENKVKLKNIPQMLKGVSNPTEVELEIRSAIEARQAKHEQDNAARKLDKDQKQQKRIARHERDVSRGVQRCIYKIASFDGQQRFKVDMNAQQLMLKGCCLIYAGQLLIVVEGGATAMNKYDRLVQHRIAWTVDELWRGQCSSADRQFSKWTVYEFERREALYDFLSKWKLTSVYNELVE